MVGDVCQTCGAGILFGGKTVAGRRYCRSLCLEQDLGQLLALELRPDEVQAEMNAMLRRPCTKCGNAQLPIGAWVSHRAVSFVIVTRWESRPLVCCQGCGRKALIFDTILTLLVGWWGLPFGLLMTPLQVARNVVGLTVVDHEDASSLLMWEAAAHNLSLRRLQQGALPASLTAEPKSPAWPRQLGRWLGQQTKRLVSR